MDAGAPAAAESAIKPATLDPGFFPDAHCAQLIDAAVRARLAGSLSTAFALLDNAAAELPPALDNLISAIRSRQVRPGIMVLYGDLIPAILEQNNAVLTAVISLLARPEWCATATHRVVTLDDAELGTGMAGRYVQHIADDPENLISMAAINAAELAGGRDRISDAMMLLAHAAPALYAEINALISEIILVKNQPLPGALEFHGASSFFLWGALILNLTAHPGRVKLVEGLVHEAAHGLLHGLTLGGPMTTNNTSERHVSPLRDDKRPMEGLVHAAYVLARMHFAMGALAHPSLLAAGQITAAEQTEAMRRYRSAAQNFRDAEQTIMAHGDFTPAGKALFAMAQDYMNAAPAWT
jgi:hypothetical protein